MPDDAVVLDPDAQRSAEIAAEMAAQRDAVSADDMEELFRVTDEMRTTADVRLQWVRRLPSHKAGYCGEMIPAEFTLEAARKKFGTGTYRVRAIGPKGFVPGGGTVTIADLPEQPAPPPSGVSDMLAILQAEKSRGSESLLKWGAMLAPLLAPALAKMVEGIFSGKSQSKEILEMVKELRAMNPPPKDPEPFEKQLERLIKLKELVGGNEPVVGSTWVDVVREIAGNLGNVIPGLVAARAGMRPGLPSMPPQGALAAPPASTGAPASDPTNPQPGAAPVGNGGLMQLLPWLQGVFADLVIQAKRDRDPALYAEVILDNVPEGIDVGTLIEFVKRQDWWPQLTQFAPAVAPYQGWFTRFRKELLDLHFEMEANQHMQNESGQDEGA